MRLSTHNNKVDLAAEGLDMAIRFGDGAWHGVQADEVLRAPLTPLCTPGLAARLDSPRTWPACRCCAPTGARNGRTGSLPPASRRRAVTGPVFDSLSLMVQAAVQGAGVALAPPSMFGRELHARQLVQPFEARRGGQLLADGSSRAALARGISLRRLVPRAGLPDARLQPRLTPIAAVYANELQTRSRVGI